MAEPASHSIRAARAGDLEALVAMRGALQAHMLAETPDLFDLAPGWQSRKAEAYRRCIDDPDAFLALAEAPDGTPLGMGLATVQRNADLDPADLGKLDGIWVEPQSRRKGIGSAIVAALLGFLGDRDVEALFLHYATGNRTAERFWAGRGFRPVLVKANARRDRVSDRLSGGGT